VISSAVSAGYISTDSYFNFNAMLSLKRWTFQNSARWIAADSKI